MSNPYFSRMDLRRASRFAARAERRRRAARAAAAHREDGHLRVPRGRDLEVRGGVRVREHEDEVARRGIRVHVVRARVGEVARAVRVRQDPPALLDRLHDGGKIVVSEDHVGNTFCNIGSRNSHRYTNISGF